MLVAAANGIPVLFHADHCGSLEVIRALLVWGFNANARYRELGNMPFTHAIAVGRSFEIATFLAERSAYLGSARDADAPFTGQGRAHPSPERRQAWRARQWRGAEGAKISSPPPLGCVDFVTQGDAPSIQEIVYPRLTNIPAAIGHLLLPVRERELAGGVSGTIFSSAGWYDATE
ncbi:hypothetical protein GGTG_09404 [Gaeumannomyces tritici R3-111a-1]|uniref:Uncharacterized protein n=1 Tax=Gaeumannomyces tritici (strain R3-111a-1) TaxID=644352 RepID=J3P7A8_GAET3|nr:hypothetical protein GGTG_09404 [Gaeumannomyces tritici R3-111a-1]EJT72539.1 hypothetical protein GGTG_09404 [Gaeumannomyces tritici R3-111a-1]